MLMFTAALALLSPAAPRAWADSNAPPVGLDQVVHAALAREGIPPEHAALALFSHERGRYLLLWRERELMTAASNAKLVTSFAALRLLSPDFRWRTPIYLVEQHDGPDTPARQGLYVRGSGDPSLSEARLDAMARHIRAAGVTRIDGGLVFDTSLFEEPTPPAQGDPDWALAPVNPYIVNDNAVAFTLLRQDDGQPYSVVTDLPDDAVEVVSNLAAAAGVDARIVVRQRWSPEGVRFTLSGELDRAHPTYWVTATVQQPVQYYFLLLRHALRRAGIAGQMPLQPRQGEFARVKRVYLDTSDPLRILLERINKDSSNVAAEALLRTIALRGKAAGVNAGDGLAGVRELLRQDFPQAWEEVSLVDGAGLNRESRVSPLFLVKLLNRIHNYPTFSHEFISSLSISGWDGTLRYRDFPPRLAGRIRAKTGSLSGVQNISGYLQVFREQVVFSFMIDGVPRGTERLQEAQERILTDIYDHLVQSQAPERPAKQPIVRN
ncbi:MAG: D-alanyl-D-alanine carboxypeptidase/D-alanyl-D-alanine-endopeptidase [Candidatus Lambdaproteobacteria bacterium]|nr:D-alanyl-D-alanine carboxypeptidase/D-alanyl-D-alanine-endopeptidase [Candidatus Lambdaproteobacteria bacterium]